jgi:hypothetical protein
MLALHGLSTCGLEVSPQAVAVANQNVQAQLDHPSTGNFGSTGVSKPAKIGSADVILGDFFQRDWEKKVCGVGDFEGFDVIYDYTVCQAPCVG